jgi:uncharacterized membrane protein YozB (DUF420 family)
MINTMQSQGFLRTAAPLYADLVLILEILMALALLFGAHLARIRKYRAHARCQSSVVILNLLVIALVMVPSFRDQVSPKIPQKLDRAYYWLPTAHAVLGSIAELAGLYILLGAGTQVLPKRFRLFRYKLWMRSVLALWWIVILLGIAVYARWYIP